MQRHSHTIRLSLAVVAVLMLAALPAAAQHGVRTPDGMMSAEARMVAHMNAVGGTGGWGQVTVRDSAHFGMAERSLEVMLWGLEPMAEHSLRVDGVHMASFASDELGEGLLWFDSQGLGGDRCPEGLGPARSLGSAEICDGTGQVVMQGDFSDGSRHGNHGGMVYGERVQLEDVAGGEARGMAGVARWVDDRQAFAMGAAGLAPAEAYEVVVDGFPAAVLTADDEGRIHIVLRTDSAEQPLPPELQPVEDLRLVEVLTAAGEPVLSGSFTGTSAVHVTVRGEVGAIGDSFFELIRGDLLLTVMVDEETAWRGALGGLEDLESGTPVLVVGTWLEEGRLQAVMVGAREHQQPVRVRGEVRAIGDAGFELAAGDHLLQVVVGDDTAWRGGLEGLDDLEIGMTVVVAGAWDAEGVLVALIVAPEEALHGVHVSGEVLSLYDDGFDLAAGDRLLQVVVDDATEWRGGLGSLADVEIGMTVVVAGTVTDEGTLHAVVVASRLHDQPLRLHGFVLGIFDSGFELETEDGVLPILVDDNTRWHGHLSGLADLEVGMEAMVMAVESSTGELLALVVAARHH